MIALHCSGWHPHHFLDCVKDFMLEGFNLVFDNFFDLLFTGISKLIAAAVGKVIEAIGTIWIDVPTIKVTSGGSYTPNQAVAFMHDVTFEVMVAAVTVSVLIAGARTALTQRGQPLRELGMSLLTLVLVSGMGLAAITLLTKAGDDIASGLIERAKDGQSFNERITGLITGPLGHLSFPMVVILGIVAIVTSLVQIILMVVRNGMLILLAGALPLAAAATNTEMGKAWFRKILGWLAAFVAYKPLAAFIYAAAIKLGGTPLTDPDGLIKILAGVSMMVMAVVALPAMLRFVAPKTGG